MQKKQTPEPSPAIYLDADGCAARYGFSSRHWLRLVDAGRAPQPTRFGRLTRWSIERLTAWETDGCRPCNRKVANRG